MARGTDKPKALQSHSTRLLILTELVGLLKLNEILEILKY